MKFEGYTSWCVCECVCVCVCVCTRAWARAYIGPCGEVSRVAGISMSISSSDNVCHVIQIVDYIKQGLDCICIRGKLPHPNHK